jgi:hypothetical protein
MIRRLVICLLMCVCLSVNAEYRIVFLNTPSIKINGKPLKINDKFSPFARVDWTSPKQAMKIVDTETGEQKLLVASQYLKAKAKNVGSYIKGVKHLSSRGVGTANVVALRAALTDNFFFTDSLKIETKFPTDHQRFFYISYNYNGEEINKMIPNDKGAFTISDDIFTIDGKKIPPFETTISLYYVDETKSKVTLITDKMGITMIPVQLEE